MKQKYNENIKELVIARIESTLPSDLKLFVGGNGGITRDEMISHVKNGDLIGNTIIKNQMNFLQAVSSGKLVELLNTV